MSDAVALPPRSRAVTRQVWTERLARFATTGLSVAPFCAAEGVSVATFYLWKRRLAGEASATAPPPLLPVHLAAPPAAVEFLLPSGTVFRIRPDTDPATLVPLLRLLGITPC